MHTVWGLTGPQFLVLYAVLVLVALGVRIVFPLGVEARGFDFPNVLFMVVAGVGVVRLVNGILLDRPVGLLVAELFMTALLWGAGYKSRETTVQRKRFWLFLAVGTGVLLSVLSQDPKQLGGAAAVFTMLVMAFPMGNSTGGGGGGAAGGGGCGGGGGGGCGGG